MGPVPDESPKNIQMEKNLEAKNSVWMKEFQKAAMWEIHRLMQLGMGAFSGHIQRREKIAEMSSDIFYRTYIFEFLVTVIISCF